MMSLLEKSETKNLAISWADIELNNKLLTFEDNQLFRVFHVEQCYENVMTVQGWSGRCIPTRPGCDIKLGRTELQQISTMLMPNTRCRFLS